MNLRWWAQTECSLVRNEWARAGNDKGKEAYSSTLLQLWKVAECMVFMIEARLRSDYEKELKPVTPIQERN